MADRPGARDTETGLWFGVREGEADNTTTRADVRKKLTLAVYSYAERKIHTIAADVDAVRGVHQIDDHRVVVIYEAGGKTIAGTVSTTDFSWACVKSDCALAS